MNLPSTPATNGVATASVMKIHTFGGLVEICSDFKKSLEMTAILEVEKAETDSEELKKDLHEQEEVELILMSEEKNEEIEELFITTSETMEI